MYFCPCQERKYKIQKEGKEKRDKEKERKKERKEGQRNLLLPENSSESTAQIIAIDWLYKLYLRTQPTC